MCVLEQSGQSQFSFYPSIIIKSTPPFTVRGPGADAKLRGHLISDVIAAEEP